MTRRKNRALVYVRRSTDKQAISLPAQVEWAVAAALKHEVALDASVADLELMQANALHSYKAIRLDDGVTGADLTRPGFLAVNRDVLADRAVSHLFIYKRDRFARPEDALDMVQVEKKLLAAGVTLVLSDGVSLPYQAGRQDMGRDISLLIGYYQGGEEIRKHAERMLVCQKMLAEGGYRTGGNAPYGFARVLVDGAGNVLEKLPPGKTVTQAGCHVRVVPDDPEKIAVWLQILELKAQGWGVKRIAKYLNALGVPSPDAGRVRTDQGRCIGSAASGAPTPWASCAATKSSSGCRSTAGGRRGRSAAWGRTARVCWRRGIVPPPEKRGLFSTSRRCASRGRWARPGGMRRNGTPSRSRCGSAALTSEASRA